MAPHMVFHAKMNKVVGNKHQKGGIGNNSQIQPQFHTVIFKGQVKQRKSDKHDPHAESRLTCPAAHHKSAVRHNGAGPCHRLLPYDKKKAQDKQNGTSRIFSHL